MQLVCPYCKGVQESTYVCQQCHENIKWVYELYQKSELYYAKGHECANLKDLTKAIKYLSKAVELNKYHIDARNLLGVVQFEVGNTGEAIKCWVLSSAVSKEENRAYDYLEKVQKHPKKLENYKEAINLYNRSLKYLEKDNEDIAVIRLRKAIHLNPRFLEARNLLAACYISQKQYTRAMEQVSYVLQVDRNNLKALKYLKEVKLEEIDESQEQPIINTKQIKQPQQKNQYRPHKAINKGHLLVTAILYFAIGGVCMLGVQMALVMPNKTASLESEIKRLSGNKEQLEKQLEILQTESSERILALEEQSQKQQQHNEELQKTSNKLKQQQKLSVAKKYADNREWDKAAEELYNISVEVLEEEQKIEYNNLKAMVFPKAVDALYNKGYSFYQAGKNIEAKTEFEKAVLYYPEGEKSGRALYYMGEIEEKNGNIVKAKQYYESVMSGYQGQKAYYWAENRLKGLAE